MEYHDLLKKYHILLDEVDRLRKANSQLRAELGLRESQPQQIQATISVNQPETEAPDRRLSVGNRCIDIDNVSDSLSKIHLFMSLFKGRGDKNKGQAKRIRDRQIIHKSRSKG